MRQKRRRSLRGVATLRCDVGCGSGSGSVCNRCQRWERENLQPCDSSAMLRGRALASFAPPKSLLPSSCVFRRAALQWRCAGQWSSKSVASTLARLESVTSGGRAAPQPHERGHTRTESDMHSSRQFDPARADAEI